jgi:phage tail sheath protein FI
VNPSVTKLCTTFSEYTDRFGSFSADDPKYSGHRALTHAVNGFFRNGGTRCFVVRINSPADLETALEVVDSIDEVSLVAAPGLTDATWKTLEDHCDRAEDRFAILDSQEVIGTDSDPDFELLKYDNEKALLPQRSKNAAFYFPWIEVLDPAKQLQDQDPALNIDPKYQGRVYVPPSGHIAGVYARTDVERGVHKAPANTAVAGALNVKYYLSKRHQEGLNPQGVNCIRNINGNIAVWGARTIGGDLNSEWKYINVRRVMLYLRESIDEGTQWVVFEPNDIALWGKIRRNVSAFLTNVWRSGALFGASPEEAFYVKCDAELNPPEVRDLGQVVTEIGVAIVRPAEFVIFRIAQTTGSPTT